MLLLEDEFMLLRVCCDWDEDSAPVLEAARVEEGACPFGLKDSVGTVGTSDGPLPFPLVLLRGGKLGEREERLF